MRHESECFHTKPDRNGYERVFTQCGFLHCSLVDNPKGLLWKTWRLCQLLWGVFHKSGDYVPASITQIMFPGASCTGLAWYESEREVGSGLFSPHTEPGQSKCLRKTCCFLLSYLLSSPVSSIPKSSNLLILSNEKQSSKSLSTSYLNQYLTSTVLLFTLFWLQWAHKGTATHNINSIERK